MIKVLTSPGLDFRFTSEQWRRIKQELGASPVSAEQRRTLEKLARLLSIRSQIPIKAVLKRYNKIESLTGRLIKEIGDGEDSFLSPMLTRAKDDPTHPDEEMEHWSHFLRDLSSLRRAAAHAAQLIGEEGASRPKNVDAKRNLIWAVVANLYEEITGEPPRASVRAPGRPNEGDADGPLVRFLKAFTAAVPNEPEPSNHQIRGFIRLLKKHGLSAWRVWEFF